MAFKDTVKRVYNSEDIDAIEGGLELDQEDPTVLDQIEAQEDEIALVEAEGELESDANDLNEGEELAEVADEEVKEAEETLAEADAKAAETGEEPVIPVEDVVASQEALKTLIKLSGEAIDNVSFGNREALYNDSRAVFAQNLEGLKEVAGKIKDGIKAIWEKIKAGFKWVVEQIKKVLPTKLNRIKWLIDNLKKVDEAGLDKEVIKERQAAFLKVVNEKYLGVAAIVEADLSKAQVYGQGISQALKAAAGLVDQLKADKDGGKWVVGTVDGAAGVSNLKNAFGNLNLDTEMEAKAKEDGLEGASFKLIGLSAKGNLLVGKYFVKFTKDGKEASKVVTVNKQANAVAALEFNKSKVIKNLAAIIAEAGNVANNAAALNTKIDAFSKDVLEKASAGFFEKAVSGRKIEANVRNYILGMMNLTTAFDSAVVAYGLSFGSTAYKALVAASKKA